MKRFILFLLCLSLYLGLIGCVPTTAVSEVVSSPTVTETAVTTETPTTLPVTPTQMTIAPKSTSTPVATPTRLSPTPTATPFDFPEMWANSHANSDYGMVWSVPVDWQERMLPAPSTDSIFWQAWINDSETSSTQYPPGQMVLTMFVENDLSGGPAGTEQRTLWGLSVWTQETTGTEADDFDLRLNLTTVREPYQYNYRLDCTQFEEGSAAEQDAFEDFCYYNWDFLFRFLGLCTIPMEQEVSFAEWQQVNDDWYQYFYLVPSGWLKRQGPTADRISFFSDPLVYNQPNECSLPNGLIKLDFSVDPPGNFGTGAPDSAPDTQGFTERTIADHPAWIQMSQGGELMGPADSGTTVYIKGDDYWYHFWLLCIPPTDADTANQDAFKAQCDDTLEQILTSFEIR